jgi:hypothetical protein
MGAGREVYRGDTSIGWVLGGTKNLGGAENRLRGKGKMKGLPKVTRVIKVEKNLPKAQKVFLKFGGVR